MVKEVCDVFVEGIGVREVQDLEDGQGGVPGGDGGGQGLGGRGRPGRGEAQRDPAVRMLPLQEKMRILRKWRPIFHIWGRIFFIRGRANFSFPVLFFRISPAKVPHFRSVVCLLSFTPDTEFPQTSFYLDLYSHIFPTFLRSSIDFLAHGKNNFLPFPTTNRLFLLVSI